MPNEAEVPNERPVHVLIRGVLTGESNALGRVGVDPGNGPIVWLSQRDIAPATHVFESRFGLGDVVAVHDYRYVVSAVQFSEGKVRYRLDYPDGGGQAMTVDSALVDPLAEPLDIADIADIAF